MKIKYTVELEIDDTYVESWNNSFLDYHLNLYEGDKTKAKNSLHENPLEKAIANQIEDYIVEESGVIKCNISINK